MLLGKNYLVTLELDSFGVNFCLDFRFELQITINYFKGNYIQHSPLLKK